MKRLSVLIPSVLLAVSTPAWADIDTTGGTTPSSTGIFPFGAGDTATYGQTFTAGASDNFLQSFSLYLGDRYDGSGDLSFKGYIAGWDGTKATSILYSSDIRAQGDGGLAEFVFNTSNLAISAGAQYIAFLSISDLAAQPLSRFYMPTVAANYAGGSFAYFNNGTNFAALTQTDWDGASGFGLDVAFKADLSEFAVGNAVPEPATWAMMIVGFGAVGASMRRRKTSVKFNFA